MESGTQIENAQKLLEIERDHRERELLFACKQGRIADIQVLLSNDVDINCSDPYGKTPLMEAVEKGNLHMVLGLCRYADLDVNSESLTGWTAVHYAAYWGQDKIMQLLIKRGARICQPDRTHKSTPLHIGAMNGHANIIKLLLKREVSRKMSMSFDMEGRTALQICARQGASVCVSLLATEAKRQKKLDLRTNHGHTALHEAAKKGSTECVDILLNKGANPNLADENGWTPLHFAVFLGKPLVEVRLLKGGARADLLDKHGHTPFDLDGTNMVLRMK